MNGNGFISRFFKGDKVIWALVVLFMLYSLLAVYSSSANIAFIDHDGRTGYYLKNQLIMLFLSFIIIYVVHRIHYKVFYVLSGTALVLSILLLILTLIFGAEINEAKRTLAIPGTSFRLQSSEIAKVALVVYLAAALTRYHDKLKDFRTMTLYLYIPTGVVCALIFKENLSTAALVFAIALLIMFLGKVPFKYLLAYIGISIVGGILMVAILDKVTENNRIEVWEQRIESFFSEEENVSDEDYQNRQAEIAIATGGIVGKGPGNSTQRNFLPQSNTDFIYAIIIEESGLIGGIFLIILYLVLLYRGIRIARKCDKYFQAFLVLGLTVMIVVQAFLNMMVAVGLFPVTGQTLPLVSWGRTSALVMSFAFGAILSVSRVIEEGETSDCQNKTAA